MMWRMGGNNNDKYDFKHTENRVRYVTETRMAGNVV